jgi:competence protein ComEA
MCSTGEKAEPVDINVADAEQLQVLPGVGASLAARIVAYRERNGPFEQVDELRDVAGAIP